MLLLGVGLVHLARKISFVSLWDLAQLTEADYAAFERGKTLFEGDGYRMLAPLPDGVDDKEALATVYNVLSTLCSVVDFQHMYTPPSMAEGADVPTNQRLWEEYVGRELLRFESNAASTPRFLDLGSGLGRVARRIAEYTRSSIVGINIADQDVAKAREHAAAHPLGYNNALDFVVGSYNDRLPFDDASFDGVYTIQSWFAYAHAKPAAAKELFRVLKPGSRAVLMGWVILPAFDESNAVHRRLLKHAKPLFVTWMDPKPTEIEAALREAGFDVVLSRKLDDGRAMHDGKDWGALVHGALTTMHHWGLVPTNVLRLYASYVRGAHDAILGIDMGLFTTTWEIIASKPKERKPFCEEDVDRHTAADRSAAVAARGTPTP